MNKLRIAILHLQIQLGNTCCNRKLINRAMTIAAGYGVNLAVTGELIESGEAFWRTIYLDSVPGDHYPFLEDLEEIASKYKMNILLGRAYRDTDTSQVYSTYVHINDEGEVQATYRKQVAETIEEGNYLAQGSELAVTNIDGFKVGLLLGYNQNIQTIINRYDEACVDLIIGGLAPLQHPCTQISIDTSDLQVPILFSNYNAIRGRRLYQGESMALSEDQSLKFCPICSEVIILDYYCECETFEVVNRINVNQVINCE